MSTNDADPEDLSDVDPSLLDSEQPPALAGRRVAFLGKLGGVNRREAATIVRQHGGSPVEQPEAELLVLGADEFPLGEAELVDDETRDRAARGEVEIISETQFWFRLGMVESDQHETAVSLIRAENLENDVELSLPDRDYQVREALNRLKGVNIAQNRST